MQPSVFPSYLERGQACPSSWAAIALACLWGSLCGRLVSLLHSLALQVSLESLLSGGTSILPTSRDKEELNTSLTGQFLLRLLWNTDLHTSIWKVNVSPNSRERGAVQTECILPESIQLIYHIIKILLWPSLPQYCVSRQVLLLAVSLCHPSTVCSLSGVDGLRFQACLTTI
jgi:hypothetical protein